MILELENFHGIKIKENGTWFIHYYFNYNGSAMQLNFQNFFLLSKPRQTTITREGINLHKAFGLHTYENIKEYLALK